MANAFYLGDQGSTIYSVATYFPAGIYNTPGPVMIGGNQVRITGMAWDATTNTLFAVAGGADINYPHHLITIDPTDGTATDIGDLGSGKTATDISINSAGQLYGWQAGAQGCLLSINKATGAATRIGSPTTNYGGGGFVFIADVAYWIPQLPGSNAWNKISTVDLGTGALTAGPDLGGDIFAIAAAAYHDGVLYGAYTTGAVYSIDYSTGVGTQIGNNISTIPDSIESVPIPPAATLPATPANDDFANATVITGQTGTQSGTTMAATVDDVPSLPQDAVNVWYSWTAPSSGNATFSSGTSGLFGEIFTGATLGSAVLVQTFGTPFAAVAGTTYHIYCGAYVFESFDFEWNVSVPANPLYPPCGTALDPQTFFGVPWRTVVCGLDGAIQTFLDRLATDRTVEFTLNGPAKASGRIPSDNSEVNILGLDGDPFVAQSDRLLYMFRREGTPSCWVCRFGGIMSTMEDQAGSDNATTSYTAFDPWWLLYHRPVITRGVSGQLPGPAGVTYTDITADLVVDDLITNMWVYESSLGSAFPEAFIDFGQTAFYTGTMETAHVVENINFTQTDSIGSAFQRLAEDGLCDIVLEPVYDPFNRPGIVAQLSVYMLAGSHRNGAIMAWDKPSKSLTQLSALYDGGSLMNRTEYFQTQGPSIPLAESAASVAKYGSYWELGMFPGSTLLDVSRVSAAELILRKDGKTSYQVTPQPGRSPIPFIEYGLGDQLPIYASNKMRKVIAPTLSGGEWQQMSRVYGINVTLSDDEMESVSLVVSTDGNF